MNPTKQRIQAAMKLQQEGKSAEAERAYRDIRKTDPANFLAAYNLAILFVQQGRLQEGEPLLAEATRLNPEILAARIVHGSILSQLGRTDDAVAVFDAVLARDFPTIQGVILLFSFIYVMVNLLVDLSYVFFDPRIRY